MLLLATTMHVLAKKQSKGPKFLTSLLPCNIECKELFDNLK